MQHLPELIELQTVLDNTIREKKQIVGDTSQQKIIAFKVEFGEFLNEHRGFKFWSENRTPRNKTYLTPERNPLLEEYVDGFHFILSVGIERNYVKFMHVFEITKELPDSVDDLSEDIFNNRIASAGQWMQLLEDYLILGYKVGFTDEMIRLAYLKKNSVNHKRQISNY